MLIRVLLYMMFFSLLFTFVTVHALSFRTTRSAQYEVVRAFDSDVPISALCLDGDTLLSTSCAGLWAQFGRDEPWRNLIEDGLTQDITWYDVCPKRKKWKNLYRPDGMWRIQQSREIVLFDDFCGCLFEIHMDDEQEAYVDHWRQWHYKGRGNDGPYESFSIFENNIICGIYSIEDELIVLGQANSNNYTKIFKAPSGLRPNFDTTLIAYLATKPAFNPVDSSIWITGFGLSNIYIIDFAGNILDSVAITGPDFRPASRPKSRIQSAAVWKDWMGQWTPVTSIDFVPPQYFLIQYRVGYEKLGEYSVPLYSTLVFSADRHELEAEVDRRWQVAGVQPDGRVILGYYQLEGGKLQIVLNVTRIDP